MNSCRPCFTLGRCGSVLAGLLLLAGCGDSPDAPGAPPPGDLPEPYTARVLIDPPEAHVGDRVAITVETAHPPGSEVLNARSVINPEFFIFEGISPRRSTDLPELRLTRQTFTVTRFELGAVTAASGDVTVIHTNAPDQQVSVPSQSVHFVSILNATEKVLDLPTGVVVTATSEVYETRRDFFRDSAEDPWNRAIASVPWWVWPLVILGLFLLLGLAVFLFALSFDKKPVDRRPTFTAVQLARREIAALRAARHAEEGRVGPFYVELSGIARRYLERQFRFNAPEQTTEEFLHDVARDTRLAENQKDLLRRFLTECDLVKFARATPTLGNMDSALGAAERFIVETETETGDPEHPRFVEQPDEAPAVPEEGA